MNTKRHLEKVLQKVEDTYWTQSSLRKKGKTHPFLYCAMGLVELTGDQPGRQYDQESAIAQRYPEAVRLLAETSSFPKYDTWGYDRMDATRVIMMNDQSTRAQVKAWVKRAIRLAEES